MGKATIENEGILLIHSLIRIGWVRQELKTKENFNSFSYQD